MSAARQAPARRVHSGTGPVDSTSRLANGVAMSRVAVDSRKGSAPIGSARAGIAPTGVASTGTAPTDSARTGTASTGSARAAPGRGAPAGMRGTALPPAVTSLFPLKDAPHV
ncbi:hypothetical protein GLS40_02005 [Pseudooceanicola sp. 216_PA32_1]|uniref:Uncharacterized protein n=1 Tax=Pseudooceanicola pacificus TaxID=2676438 RepID=A0A844W7T2_9RHOB|nr:hypothetical protein [Pseudooceanicola pacificus]MWB76793.1 hypothetical protein [Pseudooceanicola pacificus]